jgi:hypothetical protein
MPLETGQILEAGLIGGYLPLWQEGLGVTCAFWHVSHSLILS